MKSSLRVLIFIMAFAFSYFADTCPIMVSAGGSHSLTIKSDLTVWAWGHNTLGQLGDGSGSSASYEPVQVVDSGGVNYLVDVNSIATGGTHSVALKSDGTIWTWGSNTYGQLGNSSTTRSTTPVQVLNTDGSGYFINATAISAGQTHTIALKSDSTVWAWGENDEGQLGNGTTTYRTKPIQVKGPGGVGYLSGIIAIKGGYAHTLALKSDGTVWAWGKNNFGQLGDGTTDRRTTPVQVHGIDGIGFITNIESIAAGNSHSIALASDSTVLTWGYNYYGQLGDGNSGGSRLSYTPGVDSNIPVHAISVDGTGILRDISSITGGSCHTLALNTGGSVLSWGYNSHGELGNGTTILQDEPGYVLGTDGISSLDNIIQIDSKSQHSLALETDGTVWAWGDNDHGKLGDGTDIERSLPVQSHIYCEPDSIDSEAISILINSTWEDRHYRSMELAYKTCLRREFEKENIYVLHHADDLDLDDDGLNDVNGLATKTNIQDAFETWAADRAGASTKLYVYFTDHGAPDVYCLYGFDILNPTDPTKILTPTELNGYYSNYSSASGGDDIYTIISCCKSGSFIDELSSDERIIMTAANATYNSYCATPVYFGYLIWIKLNRGYDWAETFNWTAEMIDEFIPSPQIPLLDDNGDGVGHSYPIPSGGDGSFADDVFWGVGDGSRSPMDAPEILAFTADTTTYPGTVRFHVETSEEIDTCWVYFVRTDTTYEVPEYEEGIIELEYVYLSEVSPTVYETGVLRDSLPHGDYEFVALVQSPPDSTGFGDLSYPANAGFEYHGMLEDNKTPDRYALTVEPNPFNSACHISAPENAKVEIFDIEGRKVGELPGGEQIWKPEPSVGSGIYLVRATVGPSTGSGTETITKRVVYLK